MNRFSAPTLCLTLISASLSSFQLELNIQNLNTPNCYETIVNSLHKNAIFSLTDATGLTSLLAQGGAPQANLIAAPDSSNPDNLLSRWAGAELLYHVWNGSLSASALPTNLQRAIGTALKNGYINDPDTQGILRYLLFVTPDKAAQDQWFQKLTKTERDTLEAARIMGKASNTNTSPHVRVGSKELTPANIADKSTRWFNQRCSDIAERGRTLSYSGSNKHPSSLMHALTWLTCGRFIIDQNHKFACRTIRCNSWASVCPLCKGPLKFASPESNSKKSGTPVYTSGTEEAE